MRCVLVPIDGSAHALHALAHAIAELRDRPGAQLHVLNVQAPPVHAWPGKLVSPDLIEHELRGEGEKILAHALAMAQAAGVACTPHVRIGHPAHEIAATAVEYGCDAIVMGTRGMGLMAGLVLGSVAHKVVHLAHMPVTLVKSPH